MVRHLELDVEASRSFLSEQPETLQPRIDDLHRMIHEKTGEGSDYLGWLDLPMTYDKDEYARVLAAAQTIRKDSKVLVVIGIGGSYLGAKAGLEFLNIPFADRELEVLFAGHNMSSTYLSRLLNYLENRTFSIHVISKSGTTIEPAIAFRLLKNFLEKRHGKEDAKQRIYVTTDGKKGALYELAKANGYETFVIPDDIGGRFSVLTAVGLLPLAAAGVDIKNMVRGAQDAYQRFLSSDLAKNEAYLYAATRYLLYQEGKKIEMLVGYEPNLQYLNEWWKQLFAESEGKDHKGLFAASAMFSTDLHSLGQYIQQGERHLFETVIQVKKTIEDVTIPEDEKDMDQLNYLSGKTLSYVNDQALKATMLAHKEGGVPNLLIRISGFDSYTFGFLVYFFEKACAMSAYLLEVNPFDQPGVEAYKKHMFALLGKEGYQ